MSTSSNPDDAAAAGAPAKRQPTRLTLEEKVWFDRRKSDLEQYSAFGAGIGAVLATGVTCTYVYTTCIRTAQICSYGWLACLLVGILPLTTNGCVCH